MGQIYMAACGAPERTERHAEYMANVAISMLQVTRDIMGPSKSPVVVKMGTKIQIK